VQSPEFKAQYHQKKKIKQGRNQETKQRGPGMDASFKKKIILGIYPKNVKT
jgi:hypothetical protein